MKKYNLKEEDITEYEKEFVVLTSVESMTEVKKTLKNKGCFIQSSDYVMVPKTMQKIKKSESEMVLNLLHSLENNEDVSKLFSNLEIE